jgi:hypothetical protein
MWQCIIRSRSGTLRKDESGCLSFRILKKSAT